MTAMDVVAAMYHVPGWVGWALIGNGLMGLGVLLHRWGRRKAASLDPQRGARRG